MKTVLVGVALLLLAVASYAYVRNPAGSLKLLTHPLALFHSSPETPVAPVETSPASPAALAPAPAIGALATNLTAVPAPAPAPVQNSAPAAATPPLVVFKPWAPPDIMPAQPNWTWETSDGKTYQNVVVTKIEPEMVSITHSMGVGHVSISTLPPEIQKQLNYDPAAAEAARVEAKREEAHPYYTMASRVEAQAVAQQMHWPLAWVSSFKEYIMPPNPLHNEDADLTVLALNCLKNKSIIIFIDVSNEIGQTPAIVHHQFSERDDGALAGNANYRAPKIVFSNADASTILGRVSYTQMKASGEVAIVQPLASIPKVSEATSSSPLNEQPANASTAPSAPATASLSPASSLVAPVAPSVPTPSPVPPVIAPAWAPPDIMPAQPNWTWETSDGKTYQNVVVTKIGADTVSITHSMGAAHIPIANLPPEIQKQLNYDPHAASTLVALISDKLVSADGTAAPNPGPAVKYFAIYYSAQWCPPCHHFTPELVEWYNKFKPSHKNFELIFVSEDHDQDAMLAYMKEMTMPWLAVRFSDLKHDGGFKGSGIEKFAGSGIPDLVLVNADGKVLSDSFRDGTYVGPEQVMKDMETLVSP